MLRWAGAHERTRQAHPPRPRPLREVLRVRPQGPRPELIDLFPKPCPECGSTCRCWGAVPWTLVERFRAWRAMRAFRRLRREVCRKIEETDGR